MTNTLRTLFPLAALVALFLAAPFHHAEATEKPDFVIIFTDDQGYGDLSCYGGKHVSTPRIDQMAAEGAKLTSFYVAAPVCTPSHAGLMTGCYPKRINMATGSNFGVLLAGDKKGLNPEEITIPEVLKTVGYKTGMFGKWHLGDQPEFLPTKQGFDEFFGIPFSHDIGEKKNVLKDNPKVVARLSTYMADFAKDIAENSRPAAFVKDANPLSK